MIFDRIQLLLVLALAITAAQSFKFEGEETPKPVATAAKPDTEAAAAVSEAVDFGEVLEQGEETKREGRKIQGKKKE